MSISRKGFLLHPMSYRGELPGRRRGGAVSSTALDQLKQLVDQDGFSELYRQHINLIRRGHLARQYRDAKEKKREL